MSAKNSNKDSSGILFDTRTKAVMTTLPHSNQAFITQRISAVREVLPNKSNHEITLVLQYYEYNVSDTIAAFMEDGAKSALKAWNYTGNKPAKKKNKKKSSNKASVNSAENIVNSNVQTKKAAAETSFPSGVESKESFIQNEKNCLVNGTLVESPNSEVPDDKSDDNSSIRTNSSEKPKPTTGNSLSSSNQLGSCSNGERSRQHSSNISEKPAKSKTKGKKNLDKSIKDLLRHTLSFQRSGNLLNDEMDKSQKRLQQSFKDLRQILDEREKQLTKELENVKRQATELLHMRQEQGSKLRVSVDRTDSMTDEELNELRIDIKHFISERKFDDELWRTVRFVRDHSKLIGEINAYGEVVPAINHYTQRRQSVSSTTSSLTQLETSVARPVPVINNEPPSKIESSPLADAPLSMNSSSLNTAELAELHHKLKESLRLQGIPTNASFSTGNEPSVRLPRPPRSFIARQMKNSADENAAQVNGSTSNKSYAKGNYGNVNQHSDPFPRSYRQNMRRGNSRFPRNQGTRPCVEE